MQAEFKKKNWSFGQTVRVKNTDSPLDGVEGIITGIHSVNWFDTYIVTLDEPMTTDAQTMPTFQTFTMPEQCLEEIFRIFE